MKKKLGIGIIIALAVIAAVGWLLFSGDNEQNVKQPTNSEVPNLTLKNFNGREVHLPELVGKPLVLNSWAAWCPFCIDELPDFAQAQKEFGDEVTIVAINRAESLETAKSYTDELKISEDLLLLLDPQDKFYISIGGFSMPETLFINSDGSINFHKRGVMQLDEIIQRISELE